MESSVRNAKWAARVDLIARIENLADVYAARDGYIDRSEVRRVEVRQARVDTTYVLLGVPMSMIARLGLNRVRASGFETEHRRQHTGIYESVRLTLHERDCSMEVFAVSDTSPVVIGLGPLTALDLVLDNAGHRVAGNPAHNGEWITELL